VEDGWGRAETARACETTLVGAGHARETTAVGAGHARDMGQIFGRRPKR
jgi:hypothetical protein